MSWQNLRQGNMKILYFRNLPSYLFYQTSRKEPSIYTCVSKIMIEFIFNIAMCNISSNCNILAIFWALAIAMIFSNKKAALSAACLLSAQKRLFTYNL